MTDKLFSRMVFHLRDGSIVEIKNVTFFEGTFGDFPELDVYSNNIEYHFNYEHVLYYTTEE